MGLRRMRRGMFRAMTPSGGAFLACIGAGLIGLAAAPPGIGLGLFIGGAAAGAAALVGIAIYSRTILGRRPTRTQVLLVWPPVLVEFAIFWALARWTAMGERTMWLAVLTIIALHLLPMVWSFGPLIVALGLSCLCIAGGGWAMPDAPLGWIIAADGALKLVFGVWMLSGLFRDPDRKATA